MVVGKYVVLALRNMALVWKPSGPQSSSIALNMIFTSTAGRYSMLFIIWDSVEFHNSILWLWNRAAQYIACDSHAHLISKDSSVISCKSPSAVYKWSGIYYTEP